MGRAEGGNVPDAGDDSWRNVGPDPRVRAKHLGTRHTASNENYVRACYTVFRTYGHQRDNLLAAAYGRN